MDTTGYTLKTVGKSDVRYFLYSFKSCYWMYSKGVYAVHPSYEKEFIEFFRQNYRNFYGINGRWRTIYKVRRHYEAIFSRGIRPDIRDS